MSQTIRQRLNRLESSGFGSDADPRPVPPRPFDESRFRTLYLQTRERCLRPNDDDSDDDVRQRAEVWDRQVNEFHRRPFEVER